jgi:hypothetical protein
VVDGIRYINTGDWVYNNSYVVFNDGKYVLHRPKIKKVPYYFDYSKFNYKFGCKQEQNEQIQLRYCKKVGQRKE